jgi:hypothetical protein
LCRRQSVRSFIWPKPCRTAHAARVTM